MKRYLLPAAICLFCATSIQVSAAEVCATNVLTDTCADYLKTFENGNEVVECFQEFKDEIFGTASSPKKGSDNSPRKDECRAVLEKALKKSVPKAYTDAVDTSTANLLWDASEKLKKKNP
jgi:hypothetical protein